MENTDVAEWLSENPRMMGVLFIALLILTQAGQVAAMGSGNAGP